MKKIFICIFILCSCLLLTGCGPEKKDNDKKKAKEDVVEEPIDKGVSLSDEKVDIAENSEIDKMYHVLSGYGETIYKEKSYEKFEKKNDMYFISLKQLKDNYSYDISTFKGEDGTICDVNESGIYFDISNVMHLEYNDDFLPVLPSLVKCSAEEVNNTESESSK